MKKIIDKFDRLKLGTFPTPIIELKNIEKRCKNGQRIFMKRDDMSGVSLGGNKVRKLEFILADAKNKGCDTIITTGAAQSNHAMLTGACCKKLGLDCRLVLLGEGVMETKGNLLLNQIMDVPVEFVMAESFGYVYKRINELVAELEAEGKKPYVVPVGGSMPIGVLGYVEGMREMFDQLAPLDVENPHIISCTGSGGTLAGIVLGAKLINPKARVTGVLIGEDPKCKETVMGLIDEACNLMDIDNPVSEKDFMVKEYYGEGYAIPSKSGNDAIRTLARDEGIFVDPVYTGKTVGGILDLIDKDYFGEEEDLVYIHTGGVASLFAIPLEK